MARTTAAIKAGMTAEFMANTTIAAFYGFAAGASFEGVFSKVSLESMLFYIVASAINTVEQMFDTLKAYVDAALGKRLTHGRQWYVDLARAFQYGDAINPQTGKYNTIDESKYVVNYAACDELGGELMMKVATLSGDDLSPLSADMLTAFTQYMNKERDAGVVVNIVSTTGDALRLVIDIYYDPMVLAADGQLLSGGGEPVKVAIKNFIKSLPFNGEFVIASLVDALQVTEGVSIPTCESAESKYAANDWATIDARVKPYAGYMVIADEDLTIKYRPYDVD